MNWKKAEILIVKLIENNISEEDSKWLVEWLEDDEHLDYFNSFVEINYLIQSKSTFDVDASLKEVKRRIKPKSTRMFSAFLKYAASIIVLLGSAYFLFFNNAIPNVETPIVNVNPIKIGTDKATLTLEDGSEVILNKGTSYQTLYVESDGEALVYHDNNDQSHEILYNILTIPRGGQFFVQLSDGTKIWLNSESQLKYPKKFIDGKPRKVELVYGEAFFDVSPSTNHKGSKFRVLNNSQEIEVLGTKFNLKAYKDDANIYTTLKEGKIEVKTSSAKQLLIPNQQAKVAIQNKNVTVIEVDVDAEIAWIYGNFVFQNKPLVDIIKVLSRWYDVDIEIQNQSLESVEFNGKLSKQQNLEDILILIKNTNHIKQYEKNDNKILLN